MTTGVILRLVVLIAIPAAWLLLVISGASENERSHWAAWLALPFAVVLAYVPLVASLVSGRKPWPAVLALSAIVAAVAIVAHVRYGLGTDGISRITGIAQYAAYLAAVAGAALAIWHRSDASWPRDGYIAAGVVQAIMIVPPLVLFAIFIFSMFAGG